MCVYIYIALTYVTCKLSSVTRACTSIASTSIYWNHSYISFTLHLHTFISYCKLRTWCS